jgi:hypothetical protein
MEIGFDVLTRLQSPGVDGAAARAGRKRCINRRSKFPFYDGDGPRKVG